MDPRFFSILGLIPTREGTREGLNEPSTHRVDDTWTLGTVPDSLVASFRAHRTATSPPRACPAVEELQAPYRPIAS
jgi:hypothetical protein